MIAEETASGDDAPAENKTLRLPPLRNYRVLLLRTGATRMLCERPHFGQANACKPY